MNILIVSRDESTADALNLVLRANGHGVEVVYDEEEAEDWQRTYHFDMMVLADDLIDMPPETVIRRFRRTGIKTPIITLTTETDRNIHAGILDAGGDDVMLLPFDNTDLRARVGAVYRRYQGLADNEIHVGALRVNLTTKQAFVGGARITMPSSEYNLLECLVTRRNRPVSRDSLMVYLYGNDANDWPAIKIIDVFTCKLRGRLRRFGVDYIQNVWGVGYQILEPIAEEQAA